MDEIIAPAVRRVENYKILSNNNLRQEIEEMVTDVSDVTKMSRNASRSLLRHFKWDKQLLLEKYYDPSAGDAKVFSAVEAMDEQCDASGSEAKQRKGTCGICEESDLLMGLHCKHRFCSNCWPQYIKSKIDAGVLNVLCPASKCPVSVDDASLKRLVNFSQQVLEAYTRAELNDYVKSNRRMKWCPGVGCERAVAVRDPGSQQIDCDCGASFCLECAKEWHAPMTCEMMGRWLRQCADDSETYNWIHAFTKDCPKCKTAIEKNGGCNHMTCRSPACRFEFCWMCLGDWRAHLTDGQACNRFNEVNKTHEKDSKAKDARASLKRYLHYYNRYRNHEQSLKLESKLYEKVAVKIEQLQVKHHFGYVETHFLKDAVDVLSRCRRTLMFTYPFAFYLAPGENATKLFEDNQQDLELATENLSGYLERDMDTQGDVRVLRQKVQDTARYVTQRRAILLQQCDDGYECGEWSFNSEVFIGTETGSAATAT